jgi:hypothetical protein
MMRIIAQDAPPRPAPDDRDEFDAKLALKQTGPEWTRLSWA